MSQIHPTASIDAGALIGEGTCIWHYSHVRETAKIGKNCIIGEHVYIGPNVVIGDGVKIQNNVSVYEGVTIEDDAFIGPSVVFTNVINPRAFIERKKEFKPTLIRKGATVGANATIVCGYTIGEYALIGAGSLVRDNFNSHAVAVGNPAQQIGWASRAGIKLEINEQDKPEAECPADGSRYRLENGVLRLVCS